MNNRILALTFFISLAFQSLTAQDRQYYQLKIYEFANEAQEKRTDTYLKEALLPGLKSTNVSNIGVFKNRKDDPADTLRRTYVLIPFDELAQIQNVEDMLGRDKSYLANGTDYLNAMHDSPPYLRMETILLLAFEDMPLMRPSGLQGSRKDRIYELRSYESPTEAYFKNKVDMFNSGGEVKLFDRLEFNAVFYGEVIAGSSMPNLMYMTTFSDQKSRDQHWDTFRTAPEWINLKDMEKYKNNVSHIDIFFLYPTEYSDY